MLFLINISTISYTPCHSFLNSQNLNNDLYMILIRSWFICSIVAFLVMWSLNLQHIAGILRNFFPYYWHVGGKHHVLCWNRKIINNMLVHQRFFFYYTVYVKQNHFKSCSYGKWFNLLQNDKIYIKKKIRNKTNLINWLQISISEDFSLKYSFKKMSYLMLVICTFTKRS